MSFGEVCFYSGGSRTVNLVKYKGIPFCAEIPGEKTVRLKIYDESRCISDTICEGKAEFPELERGIYWFDLFCGESLALKERFVCVDKIYKEITPPDGIIYQIFVDRFNKGGSVRLKKNAVMNYDWENGIPEYTEYPGEEYDNNMFFGGTLYGVCDKLDYLCSIGVSWVYLCPIFDAFSNHKYDTSDYLKVDSMFGGRKALDLLISECHKRGMKLILDGVFNHVGAKSVYFGKALNHPDSLYGEWFDFRPDGSYDCWWGMKNLPKVKKVPSFRSFICEKVIPEYMKAGVDGWRLDVVDEYSNSFAEEITAAAKKYNENAIIIGEVWEDVTDKVAYGERKKYFCGSELDSAMNYPVRDGLIDYFKRGNGEKLKAVIENQIKHYPKQYLNCMMNFSGTHDTERILSVLGEQSSENKKGSELAHLQLGIEERAKAKKLFCALYTLLVCIPGIPMIFYGDEAGMEGLRDPFNRKPFPWGKEDKEITEMVVAANKIRKENKALICGDAEVLQCNDGFFVIRRTYGNEKILCICNLNEKYDYIVPEGFKSLNGKTGILGINEAGIYAEE